MPQDREYRNIFFHKKLIFNNMQNYISSIFAIYRHYNFGQPDKKRAAQSVITGKFTVP